MVERLIQEKQAQVEWHPFYLRPDTPPEGMELPDYVKSSMGEMNSRLKQMAAAYGLEMVFPARVPNTRLAHEATEYARDQGKGLEFHRAIFDAYYARGQDIGQWDVLRAVAAEVGLDADEMQRAVEAGRCLKARWIINREWDDSWIFAGECSTSF